ncbi:glycine betaine ABC transporter substrate-binding protein [Candidatus Poriferisodalis sp.]|uniref:glycine betaine ABC transporter substrate-binding protein n=1 Tax=Candidatus Poriferisodalis sp. TaxID=3101277 RepID=UPI003B5B0174
MTPLVPEKVPPPSTTDDVHEPPVPVVLRPGDGVVVRAAAGLLPGSAFVGEIHRQLLEMLGYRVPDPQELVARPGVAYLYLAEGEFDVWLDGSFPAHNVWLEGQRFDESRVGDHVTLLGRHHPVDLMTGWLISKDFADEHGVYTLDALDRDPVALAEFDESDVFPGNGTADIVAWSVGALPGDVAAAQAAFSGWDNIAVARLGWDDRVEGAVSAIQQGIPVIAVTSSPSELVAKLRPGHEVYWLGIEDFLDGSNPLGHPDGKLFSQFTRGLDGAGGHAPVSPDECPSAAADPRGLCPLGWVASTRTVAARAEFVASNPAAAELLDAVFVPAADISQALVREAEGTDPAALASEWIAANRAPAEEWLTAARAAADRP